MTSTQPVSEPADWCREAVPVQPAAGGLRPPCEGPGVCDGGLGHLGRLASHPEHHREEFHLVGAGEGAGAAAGVPAGPGVGPPAAAELLEEAALPARGERGEADPAHAGEGQLHRVWDQQWLTIDLNDGNDLGYTDGAMSSSICVFFLSDAPLILLCFHHVWSWILCMSISDS